MSDSELTTVLGDLISHENLVSQFYLDTRGLVTIGIGHMVKSADSAALLPMFSAVDDSVATSSQIRAAWTFVSGMEPAHLAKFYARPENDVYMREEDARALAASRLRGEFEPGLARVLGGDVFAQMPVGPRRGLFDLAYNLGVGGVAKFANLLDACRRGDWDAAAGESNVKSSRPERNQWRADRFLGLA